MYIIWESKQYNIYSKKDCACCTCRRLPPPAPPAAPACLLPAPPAPAPRAHHLRAWTTGCNIVWTGHRLGHSITRALRSLEQRMNLHYL